MSTTAANFFSNPFLVFTSAFLLRLILLIYGIHQDSVSSLKYTDIDYYVFTDAARAVARHSSPYDRATYRYTPLLAWLLWPTTWGGLWFHFGKALFAISDLIAGWIILVLLKRKGLDGQRALKFASIWLLNPMVANISTRGSSEGLLCVLVMMLLWAFDTDRINILGCLLGFCVHFKIYPFIYGASMLWALETKTKMPGQDTATATLTTRLGHLINESRIRLVVTSLTTFTILNLVMYAIYGPPFVQHTFLHHLTRIDHRHNFSPYNILLYLSSARTPDNNQHSRSPSFESLAFVPQILLSTILIPLAIPKANLATTMLAQTLAFVTFNKVCTSQYFLWYLIFLPMYLPTSSLLSQPKKGITALVLWILSQAMWLQQGYQLEFLGKSTFVPGLWIASLVFFGVNCWILGIIVDDGMKLKAEDRQGGHLTQDTTATGGKDGNKQRQEQQEVKRNREDRKASVSGTSIGVTHLGPRNRMLKSQAG